MALKFLIIDDHADYRRLLSHHLSTRWPDAAIREYDPLASGRLPETFSGAGNDLILLGDPCEGREALHWLRQFRARPRFPPVILIGGGGERQIVAGVKAGAEDYVSRRTLTHARLIGAIEAALENARRAQSVDGSRSDLFGGRGNITSLRGYDVIRRLADGDISTVYLVRERASGTERVLKVLRQLTEAGEDSVLDRFLREYQLIARLDHPNIVRIFDFGVADDHAYIAMEFCGGGSLKRRITQGLVPGEAYRLLREIAGALAVLHSAGILHRDLKPTNVLFREDGSVALIDFGLAKQAALQAEVTGGAGAIFGTPYYMSPEQGHGEPVDERGDIYSLGVMFFEMLTGTKPFEGETPMSVIIRHRQAAIPSLPADSSAFHPLLDRMLAKKPEDRFQSIGELLAWQPPG